jgi:hypothetical protein
MKLAHRIFWTLVLLSAVPLCAQTPPNHANRSAAQYRGNILEELAPHDNIPLTLHLEQKERTRAIRMLLDVKRENPEPWRRQLATYLLATLDYNYTTNRDELLHDWSRTNDDGLMELLNDIYKQGHKECLLPLMRDDTGYNIATSEGIGEVYSNALTRNPEEFLAILASLPKKRQNAVCGAIGRMDGGGISDKKVSILSQILRHAGSPLALQCAQQIRAANREAEKEARQP